MFAGEDVKDYATDVTPLIAAARVGSVEIVCGLIKAKANVKARDQHGSTALLEACKGGNFDIYDAVIKAGADVSAAYRAKVSKAKAPSATRWWASSGWTGGP